VRDVIENFGEVAAYLMLYIDRRNHQIKVITGNAPQEIRQSLLDGQAQPDLARDAGKFTRNGLTQFF